MGMTNLAQALKKVNKELGSRKVNGSCQKCQKKATGLIVLVVKRHNEEMVARATVDIKGKKPYNKKTDGKGIAKFKPVDPDTYSVNVTLPTSLANDFEKPAAEQASVLLGSCPVHIVYIDGIAPLKVVVRRSDKKNEFIKGARIEVKAAEAGGFQGEKTSDDKEPAVFEKLKVSTYTVSLSLSESDKDKYKIDNSPVQNYTLDLNKKENKVEFTVTPFLRVYLKLLFTDPEKNKRVFPEKVPVRLVPESGASIDAIVGKDGVLYSNNNPWAEVPRSAKSFTLDFKQDKANYIVCEKRNAAKTQELVAEADLAAKITAGHRVFRLPTGNWTLKNSDWEPEGSIPAYKKNQCKFADLDNMGTTIGSSKDNPARLLLNPHWQFYRFEYFDRCYGHSDHGDKRISIPPIMLKGVRKCPGGSSTNYDAISNWTTGNDDKQLLQCLPWIISKKDDGSALGKLDKDMLLEFGQKNTFVFSKSATEREIQKLDPSGTDKDKLKPGPNRTKYYDLPKLWKSKNYYTRLSGGSGKFFDELTEADIEGANDSGKPLAFSLDDVILVDNSGNQIAKDQDKDGNPNKDFSEHSRLTLLYLDPDEKFKVKVYEPRVKAAYHTKAEFSFAKDAAGKYRNVIVNCDPKIRVVVFCSGFHDIYDKRTESADFGKKQILGARAAKMNDGDISVQKRFDQNSDVNNAYVHMERVFDAYYLHYGGTDGTTVYGALVTYWSARFFYEDDADKVADLGLDARFTADKFFKKRATHRYPAQLADKRNYIEQGMKNAMDRWSEKDYQFEEEDNKKDIIVKTFTLFEAKEFEEPANTFVQQGGEHKCLVVLVKKPLGSWATDTVMRMRNTAFQGEGASWASAPGTEARANDYDGSTAAPRNAFAHELGHAAIGLYDDYITVKQWGLPGYQKKQRYPGVPYYRDESSIMSVNQAVRLRQFWGRANWINDEAKATKTLNKFLQGKQFKITYAPADKTKTKLNYFRDAGSRSIYKPSYTQEDYSLGEQGKCDLLLYKLGDDEFARLMKGDTYNGILVVETRIKVTFKTGLTPATSVWATGAAYTASKCIEQEGKFYVCLEDHTSGAFLTDLGQNKWLELDPSGPVSNWAANTDYSVKKWVKQGGDHYVCVTNHKSGAFIPQNFVSLAVDKGDWKEAKDYVVGDTVLEGGRKYVCLEAHTSSATFAADSASKWLATSGTNRGNWVAGTAYVVGDECKEGGITYFCRVAHTSGSLAADVTAKRLVKSNSKPSEWTLDNKEDWVGGVNKQIMDMMEGYDDNASLSAKQSAGKLRLTTSPANKDFSNTYVRVFARWWDGVGDAPTEDTRFTFEVTKGGSATFFYPTGSTIKVAMESNSKTIVRYLYGQISDNAVTRAAQKLTDDLTAAELSKLKDWIQGKVGGVFEVKAIV